MSYLQNNVHAYIPASLLRLPCARTGRDAFSTLEVGNEHEETVRFYDQNF